MAVGLAAAMLTGCGTPGPRSWNLSITKNTTASIQVDLIGITESEKPYWEGYNLDKYWSDGDLRRKEAQPLTEFLVKGKAWEIPKTDPKWKEWFDRGDTQLLIIAQLPGNFDAGPADPRRIFVPLQPVYNAKDDTLEIEVLSSMVHVITPLKAK